MRNVQKSSQPAGDFRKRFWCKKTDTSTIFPHNLTYMLGYEGIEFRHKYPKVYFYVLSYQQLGAVYIDWVMGAKYVPRLCEMTQKRKEGGECIFQIYFTFPLQFLSLKKVKDYSWRILLLRKNPRQTLSLNDVPNFNHYTNFSLYRLIKIIPRYSPFKMSFSGCKGPDAGR